MSSTAALQSGDVESVARRPPERCPVTIVAHDVGPVGGMERQLAELALGLRRARPRGTVIARTCELPADTGVVFHRVRGPSRPFLVAYPWFCAGGIAAVWRHRRGVVQATGAIVLNRVDAIAVHCCHQVHRASPNRPTAAAALVRARGGADRAGVRAAVLSRQPGGDVRVRLGRGRRGAARALPRALGSRGDDPQRRRHRRASRPGCARARQAHCASGWGWRPGSRRWSGRRRRRRRGGWWSRSSAATGGTRACVR